MDDIITTNDGYTITITFGLWFVVKDVLLSLHPEGQPADPTALLDKALPNALPMDPIMFECLNGDVIKNVALHSKEAAGPLGVDAVAWQRMCSSYKEVSSNLCEALARVARRICTTMVPPDGLGALIACRLVPLNKNPGVRPIGVGEVARRIICKAIMIVVKKDVMVSAGPLQMCTGIPSGCEAAVHAMTELFKQLESQEVLLVDAENAFNSLNRNVALHNISYVCPALAIVLNNCYWIPSRLIVSRGGELLCEEGTTQGDPLGMAMFALLLVPLQVLLKLSEICESLSQVWFADDAFGAGSFKGLRQWWDALSTLGPSFGYHPKASKTCLVIHPDDEEAAQAVFGATGIIITTEGKWHLGGALGSVPFMEEYLKHKVDEWRMEVEKIAEVAGSQPQAAYAAFVHGTINKWNYVCRTVANCGHLLQPVEDAIQQKLIPTTTRRPPCSWEERALLALPTKLGGLGLTDPTSTADHERDASREITASMVQSIITQETVFSQDPTTANTSINDIKRRKKEHQESNFARIYDALEPPSRRLLDCACEPGASTWLSAVPVEEHGFCLSKSSFTDALSLWYGWQLPDLSSKCACGKPFSVAHVMICHKGGLPTLWHNEVRDLTAALLAETCKGVSVEPPLQALDDEEFNFRSSNRDDEA